MSRYMILKNQKILSLEVSMDDVEGAIGRDFRVKKQDYYEVQDLELDVSVCIEALLKQLRVEATPEKKITFPTQKQRKPLPRSSKPIARSPIARSSKPIARTPIARSNKPIARSTKPIKRTPLPRPTKAIARTEITRKPVVFPANKPFVQPERKPYKKPKPGRNDIIDDAYSKWLGTQPCVITGQVADRGIGPYNTHCHHIKGRARGRRNDHMQVPLTGHLHTYANHSYHVLGKSGFLEKWKDYIPDGVDDIVEYFETCAKAFKGQYDAEMKGLLATD